MDRWAALKKNFALLNSWSPYTRSGAWSDADMLPLGRIGIRAERGEDRKTHFTPNEQQILMSLWSIARSPLMFGGDLPSNDEATYALISNDEVLRVDQHATHSHQLFANGNQIAWVSNAQESRAKYLWLRLFLRPPFAQQHCPKRTGVYGIGTQRDAGLTLSPWVMDVLEPWCSAM